jgi:L-lactate dehydrogenase complex protein LldG
MADDRDQILRSIREALDTIPEGSRTAYPQWDRGLSRMVSEVPFGEPWERFADALKSVHGTPVEGLDALANWMREQQLTFGYCDPALATRLREHGGFEGITLETDFDRARIDAYQFGITRAANAIAETGTVVFKDTVTSARLAALAPWVHIALLAPHDLVEFVDQAIDHLGDDPSVIWATGPSKTADVEGILIEGVHGPGVQVVCLDR